MLALGVMLLAAPSQAQLAMKLEMRGAGSWDSDCRTVPNRNTNGTITFSRNGTDLVELAAASGGEVPIGRYWNRAADRNGPPAAMIRMVKPPR